MGIGEGVAVAYGPVRFDFDGVGFAGGIVVETAPAIVFGFGDYSSGYWVEVDVLDLFYEFGCGEDVEVVVPGLPEMFAAAFEEF